MTKGSLRLRLFTAASVSIVFALFLTGIALTRLFENQVRERVVLSLENDMLQLAGAADVRPDGSIDASRALADPRYEEPYGGRYWHITVSPPSGSAQPAQTLRSPSLWDFEIDPAAPLGPEGEELITLRRDITVGDGNARKMSVLVAASEEEVTRSLAEFRDQLLLGFTMMGAVLIAAAWVQVTVGLSPMERLRTQITAIRQGAAQRLSGSFPDEVAPLVDELNDVLDMRDASLERARRRAGDLAHGLKTPLTVLAAIARHLRKDGRDTEAADIEEQSDAMQRHVERALVRARLSSGKGFAASELETAVRRVVSAVERLSGAEALTFDIRVPPEARVPVEQRDLMELLGNLIDNARKWGCSMVRVGFVAPVLTIEDDGPGVAEEELCLLGERGRRLDESKQGSGLGLSIVEDIADIYGLAVSYGRSGLGGLRVDIRV